MSEIEEICDIKKHLTIHIGRHTFVTTVTLTNEIPIETVNRILGHSDISTTQIYSEVVDTTVSEEMGRLAEKFSSGEIYSNAH